MMISSLVRRRFYVVLFACSFSYVSYTGTLSFGGYAPLWAQASEDLEASESSEAPEYPEASGTLDDLFDDSFTEESREAATPLAKMNLRLYGEHEFIVPLPIMEGYINFQDYSRAGRIINTIGLEYQHDAVKLLSEWKLNLSLNQLSKDTAPQSLSDLLSFTPGENYVAWSPGQWRFALGLQEFSWGVADGIRPTDNLNPVSMKDSFERGKLPIFAASVDWYPFDIWQLSAVFSLFRPDNILSEPLDQLLKDKLSNKLGAAVSVALDSPDFDWSNSSAGLRSSFYTQYFDLSFSYLFGLSPYYSVAHLDVIPPAGPQAAPSLDLLLTRQSYDHIFGLDFKSTFGPLGFWAEAAYTLTQNYDLSDAVLRKHSLSWVVGADISYGPSSALSTNVQFFGTWIPSFDWQQPQGLGLGSAGQAAIERSLNEQLAGQSSGLQLGLALHWALDLSKYRFKATLDATYLLPLVYDTASSTRYGGLVLKPELSYSLAESLELFAGLRFAYSWEEDEAGQIQPDSSLPIGSNWYDSQFQIGLRYAWSSK